MKQYDLAFGMGFSCAVSQSLRESGLQYASFPLDWIGSPGLAESVAMIVGGFADWFNREDLVLHAVRRAPLYAHVYRNAKTGFGFPHDFPSFRPFDELYAEANAKYARRIPRFLETLARSRKVLAVYLERPINRTLTDAELITAHAKLAAAFPGSEIDLVYFHRQDDAATAAVREVSARVTAVGVDLATRDGAEISNLVRREKMSEFLSAYATVADVRDAAAVKEREKFVRGKHEDRWHAKGPWSRFVNAQAFKLYRRLEKFLVARGLVPREGPLWF